MPIFREKSLLRPLLLFQFQCRVRRDHVNGHEPAHDCGLGCGHDHVNGRDYDYGRVLLPHCRSGIPKKQLPLLTAKRIAAPLKSVA